MKIAVCAQNPGKESLVDPRFGRAKHFVIFDDTVNAWETVDNAQNLAATQGAGIQSASNIVNAGCGVLISGHCGPKAFSVLQKAGVVVYGTPADSTVEQAVAAYRTGTLKKLETADVERHW